MQGKTGLLSQFAPLLFLILNALILLICSSSGKRDDDRKIARKQEQREDRSAESEDVPALLKRIYALADQISGIASSKTNKWNERIAEKDLDALLKKIYSTADRIRESTPELDLPQTPDELEAALETVRVRMLQARKDIRRRTAAEREYYQLVALLNQAVLQVKSGMKTGDEARQLVRNALRKLESYPAQPYFSQQLVCRAERAEEEARELLHSI